MAAAAVAAPLEVLCGGHIDDESEFRTLPDGRLLTAACGPNIASALARWADQRFSANTVSIFEKMRSLGRGDNNGASTPADLAITLGKMGYHLLYPASGETCVAFLRRMAGQMPVCTEVSNGQALREYLTGTTEDASNLHYHYIGLFGYNSGGPSPRAGGRVLPAGFWFADGDSTVENPIVNGRRVHRPINGDLVYYPAPVVTAARPCAVFAVLPRAAIPTAGGNMLQLSDPEVARYFTASATGWRCTTGATIPSGPLLDYYRSAGAAPFYGLTLFGLPLRDPVASATAKGVQFLVCERGTLALDTNHLYDRPPGVTGPVYPAHVNLGEVQRIYAQPLTQELLQQVTTLTGQVRTLTAQVPSAAEKAILGQVKAASPSLHALANALTAGKF